MDDLMTDVKRWRERAVEARSTADDFKDPGARRTMLDIAQGYDSLAAMAERNLARHKAG